MVVVMLYKMEGNKKTLFYDCVCVQKMFCFDTLDDVYAENKRKICVRSYHRTYTHFLHNQTPYAFIIGRCVNIFIVFFYDRSFILFYLFQGSSSIILFRQ